MTFETALLLTQVIMAGAFLQQSAEHWALAPKDRVLFGGRILACLLLLSGFVTVFSLVVLCVISMVMLARFGGVYNGGSDKMSLLVLWCVTGAYLLPGPLLQEVVFAYLAVQLTLSYFISGQVKVMNPSWRSGQALCDVFAFSAYPVSKALRKLGDRRHLLFGMSWAVIGFELAFALTLLHPTALIIGLICGALFHLANAVLFGLNRFFWIWLAAYPALIWLQGRIFQIT